MKTIPLIFSLAVSLSTYATDYFVKPNGDPNNDGAFWDNALTYEKAIDLAKEYGDRVFFAQGEYIVTTKKNLNKAGVTYIGGFQGTEDEYDIDVSDSKPTQFITKFTSSEDRTDRIFSIGNTTDTDPITIIGITIEDYHCNQSGGALEFSSNCTTPIVLTNCYFKNISPTVYDKMNGAIVVNGVKADVDFLNCHFENVYSTSNAGAIGINLRNSGTVTIKKCTFKNTGIKDKNEACGGAIYFNSDSKYSAIIEDCDFDYCSSLGMGGAIYLKTIGSCVIRRCNFTNCTTNSKVKNGHGGAIFHCADNLTIEDCLFDKNSDTGRGLIYFTAVKTNTIIKKCIFTNNKSIEDTGNSGAVLGIQSSGQTLVVDSCYMFNNSSSSQSSGGSASAIYSADGTTFEGSLLTNDITISNSLIIGNIGNAKTTCAVKYSPKGDNFLIKNSIICNNTNQNTDATYMRDFIIPNKTNPTNVTIEKSIFNNGYYESASKETDFPTNYNTFLSAEQMNSITSQTNIKDIVAAANVILNDPNVITSINEINNIERIQVSSNEISLANNELANFYIYDSMGKMIKTIKNSSTANISNLPSNMYILRIETNKEFFTSKFMK